MCVRACVLKVYIPYSLDQTPLSISRRSRIVAAPPEVLNEIVAALEPERQSLEKLSIDRTDLGDSGPFADVEED